MARATSRKTIGTARATSGRRHRLTAHGRPGRGLRPDSFVRPGLSGEEVSAGEQEGQRERNRPQKCDQREGAPHAGRRPDGPDDERTDEEPKVLDGTKESDRRALLWSRYRRKGKGKEGGVEPSQPEAKH